MTAHDRPTGASRPRVVMHLGNHSFAFASTSELKAQLLDAFKDAAYAGGPLIIVNRDDTAPAWQWVGELIRVRSDWRECAGIALQHAVLDGGSQAQTTFADLMANQRSAIVLRRWTVPLALRFPAVTATSSATNMGGGSNPRLDAIMVEQAALAAAAESDKRQVLFSDWHGAFKPRVEPMPGVAELRALLIDTSLDGRSVRTEWGAGPWGWLHQEYLFRPWVYEVLPEVMREVLATDAKHDFAALDWLCSRTDTRRFRAILEAWRDGPSSWWSDTAITPPLRWRQPVLGGLWRDVKVLGDVVGQLLANADHEDATRPDSDLPERC